MEYDIIKDCYLCGGLMRLLLSDKIKTCGGWLFTIDQANRWKDFIIWYKNGHHWH